MILAWKAVLRIRDILVRIRGSVPRQTDPDTAIFVTVAFKMATKNYLFSNVIRFLRFEATFASLKKNKKSWRSDKLVGITVFLTIFVWW